MRLKSYAGRMVKGMERIREPHISGNQVEQELLGEVAAEYFERYKEKVYVPYRQAMTMVKETQPFDPSDPEPRFANDLHASVAEKLELEDYSQLKFYTAVSRTHFDVFHGVDAFLEFRFGPNDADTIMATLDLTTRPKEARKADALVTVPDEGFDLKDPEDKKRYRDCVEEAATILTRALQDKLGARRAGVA